MADKEKAIPVKLDITNLRDYSTHEYSNYTMVSANLTEFVITFCRIEAYNSMFSDRYDKDDKGSPIIKGEVVSTIYYPTSRIPNLIKALDAIYKSNVLDPTKLE